MANPTFHKFLVEHAKFPCPLILTGNTTTSSTDVKDSAEVERVQDDWKARHAVRNNSLVRKLCDALESILGQTPLVGGLKNLISSIILCLLCWSIRLA